MTRNKGKEPSSRQLRVGEELRHALAEIFERGDAHDPDLSGVTLTVTEVRISPDLRNATAFVVPLGHGGSETLEAALARAVPFFRREIARRVRLKYVPVLSFRFDDSFETSGHIAELLRRPAIARDLSTVEEDDKEPPEE